MRSPARNVARNVARKIASNVARSVARNVARNLATNARLHCNSLLHGFTFLSAQGTDLRTGTVAISCKYIHGIFFLEESTEKTQWGLSTHSKCNLSALFSGISFQVSCLKVRGASTQKTQ